MIVHNLSPQPQSTVVKERSWDGFRANLVKTTAGRFLGKQSVETSMMFHLGPPARVRCDYDGHASSRIQSRGKFDVIPLGCLASWDDADPTFSMNVWLSQSVLDAAARSMKSPSKILDLRPKISEEDERLFGVAQLLKSELESPTPDNLFASSLATAMAVRMLERYGMREVLTDGSTLSRRQFRLVTEYIQENLSSEIRLASLARLVGLSESHFRVLFRRTAGRPVHSFVVERRLQRARELLQSGRLPVAQVALETGFCHQSHLAKTMRREWRITPSQMARNARAAI